MAKLTLETTLPDYVKVRLYYLTPDPVHVDSFVLREMGAETPYIEHVAVWMSPERVRIDGLQPYESVFNELVRHKVVSDECVLLDIRILEEDGDTEAWVLPSLGKK